MTGDDYSKIPHCRRPICLQYVVRQTLSQQDKSHLLRIPHDDQVPYRKQSRNGSRRSTSGQGMLLSIRMVDNVYMDELDTGDEVVTRPEPSEELEPVSPDDDPEHLVYIGSKLAEDLKGLLTQFLKQNKDVFAWKQANMGGIDPAVITHRLNVSPSFKPIK